jgi:hypothetical protein
MVNPMDGLQENVDRFLQGFVETVQHAFAANLVSVVLYGSGAEGKLRATSDVNVIVVLSCFDPAQADRIREALNLGAAAVRLQVMFLLEDEIGAAVEAFAQKFSDVAHRRKVLHGLDPFAGLEIPRAAAIHRLKQVLLNLMLRMRESYVTLGAREAELAAVIANQSGPLRTCAANLLQLEGSPAASPKEAFEAIAKAIEPAVTTELGARVSDAREQRPLAAGAATGVILELIRIASHMRERALRLA